MIEEKSNVSRVQKQFGSYRFRIEGYSGLSNRVGDSIESPEFTICGHCWQLRIFPGGSLESHKSYISYYLASKSTRQARASYKLSIVNQIPGGEDEQFASSGVRVFEAKGLQVDGWGRDKFVAASMLKDPDFGLCVDDNVIFKVDITVFGELEHLAQLEDCNNQFANNQTLPMALKSLFNDPITTDITITIGSENETLFAHKCILIARSDVFRAMFRSNMKETQCGEIFIEDFESCIIKEMVYYMYTDIYPDTSFMNDQCLTLLKAAAKYQILGLKEYCELFISNALQVDTAIPTLIYAENIGAALLKEKTLAYIAQNSLKVVQLKEFQELDGVLLKEANTVIDTVNKRKGCRSSGEKDRRSYTSCMIM